MVNAARGTIGELLEKVREESELRGVEKYYTAFVIMMYTVSSSILSQSNPSMLKKTLDAIEVKDEDKDSSSGSKKT